MAIFPREDQVWRPLLNLISPLLREPRGYQFLAPFIRRAAQIAAVAGCDVSSALLESIRYRRPLWRSVRPRKGPLLRPR